MVLNLIKRNLPLMVERERFMSKKYVFNRAFNNQGYFFIYHFLFWVLLVINVVAYLGNASGVNEILGASLLVIFFTIIHSLNFGFKKLNTLVISKANGIEADYMNLFFKKSSTAFLINEIEKIEHYEKVNSKGLILCLKSGKFFILSLETFCRGGDEFGPSRFVSDFSIEEDFKSENKITMNNDEESISNLVYKIITTYQRE